MNGSRLTAEPGQTVGDVLAGARAVLEAAGVPEPRREAEELYAALVGRATSAAWLERGQPAPASLRARLEAAARRRADGWPQAYAAGRANFRGHWLSVDRRVLIPRPETEGLVDVVLAWMREGGAERGGRPTVADVGTGSGAIAVALALESPAGRIVATDRSPGALEVAGANVAEHGVASRVSLVRGDLLGPLGSGWCDVVVSNPPYVTTGDWERLQPGVRDHEPREALDGGPDGLEAIRELVLSARAALGAGGLLALEVDAPRAERVAELVVAAGFVSHTVLDDLFGRPRYVRARRPADGSD
jgi:release factor glutamine methyltransferase